MNRPLIPDWVTRREAAEAGLGLAVMVSGILLISLDANLTFFADDWGLLLQKQSWAPSTFLDPYEEHLILGTVFVFKVMQELFGMGSAMPYYVVSISLYLASAVLLFIYLRERIDDWLALIGAVLILFLGAAFEDLLWISPLNFSGSMIAGLGMLLALDRGDDKGDRIACVLLAVSIAFSSVGLAFAAGAFVDLILSERPRRRRAYVVFAPLALFALWWLGWGRNAETKAAFSSIWDLPGFIFDAAAAGFTSLLGLATGDGSEPDQPHLIWGKLVLIVAAVFVVARIVRVGRIPKGLAVALAIGFAFWVLIGLLPNLSATAEHAPTSSRYQYITAIFLLLILAEALRGIRIPMRAILVTAVVAGWAVVGGVNLLDREYDERWRPFGEATRYSLGAVEIAGASADPAFLVEFPPTLSVTAHTYLETVRKYGSPAYGESRLETAPPGERLGADLTIAQALGLALGEPTSEAQTSGCETLEASSGGETGSTLLHGDFSLTNEGEASVEILLSRFADEFSVDLGSLEAGLESTLAIPPDESDRPWNLGLRGSGPVRLCATEAAS